MSGIRWREMVKIKEIVLLYKEYSLLERSIRSSVLLSSRLCRNLPISKNALIIELIEEIRDFEYDEDEGTPLEFRIYEEGRILLKNITEQLYPNDVNRFIKYIEQNDLINFNNSEQDFMVTIKII